MTAISPLAARICEVYNFAPFTRRNGGVVQLCQSAPICDLSSDVERARHIATYVCAILGITKEAMATDRLGDNAIIARRAITYIAKNEGMIFRDIGAGIGVNSSSLGRIYNKALDEPFADKVLQVVTAWTAGQTPELPRVRRAA